MRFILFVSWLLLWAVPVNAQAPTPSPEASTSPMVASSTPISTDVLIDRAAAKYGVSRERLTAVLSCESGLSASAVGDHGTSFGIAQIHLPAHPDISKSQALDAAWSIDWAAHQFSLGHASMWTCARQLGY